MSSPFTTPVTWIDSTGVHLPAFADVLTYFETAMRTIHGSDIYIANDSQDGQLIGIFALATNDLNGMAVQAYNAFSPATAQGTGLSSVVKINGIRRKIPSYSTVDLLIIGQAGTIISNGVVSDSSGNAWLLPATVTVPAAGQITVTATASLPGAILAPALSVFTISTPTPGWQSAMNFAASTVGQPTESDIELRDRQAISSELPSVTAFEGLLGAVRAVAGVSRLRGYENNTDVVDDDSVPGHSISLVVDGGDSTEVASLIALKKTPGTGTYGTTVVPVTNAYGITGNIAFFRPTAVNITFTITVKALAGYSALVQSHIIQSLVDWVNALGIGNNVRVSSAYTPANLSGTEAATFEIMPGTLKIARDGNIPTAADVVLTMAEVPYCETSYVTIALV
jgi:uncharacterized phage protein gp47/JayE